MKTITIASLDSEALARRLRDLVGEERNIQVDFLLHLDEFDRRRAYLEAGFPSLWDYCLRVLYLREGAAGRRIGAMRVLRRFPGLEAALRDGRLCLSTLALLGQVLTDQNADELLSRAAYRSKAEVDALVASVKPRPTPAEGIRKLPVQRAETTAVEPRPSAQAAPPPPAPSVIPPEVSREMGALLAPTATAVAPPSRDAPASEMRAVSENRWSLRVTIDGAFKEDLVTLAAMLSHKIPRGDVAAVLHEAIRCGIETHGKRKGAVMLALKKSLNLGAPGGDPRSVPMEVRRQVWKRDGGRCTWAAPDGRRCGSRWQLELDHIEPLLLGGRSTVDNLRLRCRGHNLLYAEQTYGRQHMERFRRQQIPNG